MVRRSPEPPRGTGKPWSSQCARRPGLPNATTSSFPMFLKGSNQGAGANPWSRCGKLTPSAYETAVKEANPDPYKVAKDAVNSSEKAASGSYSLRQIREACKHGNPGALRDSLRRRGQIG